MDLGHSFYVATVSEATSHSAAARSRSTTAGAHAQAVRRARERRSVIFDAVVTALGLKPRRYPQTPEGRLERALNNIAADRDRGGF